MAVDLLRLLSIREIEILTLVVFGHGHRDIYYTLGVKRAQVDKIMLRIYRKCRVDDVVGLMHIFHAYKAEFHARLERKNSLVIPLADFSSVGSQHSEPPFSNDEAQMLLDDIKERAQKPWLEDDEELRLLIMEASSRDAE